jgi:hypothetical protein
MTARYIDIAGRKIRIEFCWNTVIDFLDYTGMDLDKFIGLAAGNGINPRMIRQLAWSGAIEGERLEGRELGMNEIEFGALLHPQEIQEIMAIFAEQFSGIEAEKKKKGRNPLVHFRLFR